MTLVVSARVPDGIVVGADSLSTLTVSGKGVAATKAKCPNCGGEHDVEIEVELPQGLGTLSTSPHSLKLIPLFNRIGVAITGMSMIGRRTVLSLLLEWEDNNRFEKPSKVARDLGKWLHDALKKQTDVAAIPEDKHVLGFQVSGYEDEEPKTFIVNIGNDVKVDAKGDFGVTVSGETAIIKQLWQLRETNPQMGSAYNAWSVLDAADYVKFAIATTANFQRFLTMIPTVGGDIHMALITAQGRFTWIDKKPLADLLLPLPREEGDKQDG